MAISASLRWLGFAFFCVSGYSQAADRVVSPLGNDAAEGTGLLPWKTIQKAANSSLPGDIVTIKAGVYYETVVINVSGTESQPVTFRAAPGESVVLDGSNVVLQKGQSRALVSIGNKKYVTLEGLELRNLRTSVRDAVPMGILINGTGTGIIIRNNIVHHIEQNGSKSSGVDAHGIAVYGDAVGPVSNLLLEGNEVRDCILGSSEALVVNGNVKDFIIRKNIVHDCNNIGIDVIGFEGTCPDPLQDRARDGLIQENTVYNIDTFYNPAYGGKAGKGGGERSAAGIYVDGGKNLVIERNQVFNCNFGAELASEWPKGSTEDIVFRNNLIYCNMSSGLIMGGYDSLRGKTRRVEVTNNTFYNNDKLKTWAGQITLQYYVSDLKVENNIFWAEPGNRQILVHEPYGKKVTAAQKEIGANVRFDYNRFYCGTGISYAISFSLFKGGQQRTFAGLSAWQTASYGLQADLHSSFGIPGFQTTVPGFPPPKPFLSSLPALASSFALASGSACIDAANPALDPDEGENDYFGQSRKSGGRVDIGAAEWQAAP